MDLGARCYRSGLSLTRRRLRMASSGRRRFFAGAVDLHVFHEPAVNLRFAGHSVDGLLVTIVLASSRLFDSRSHRRIDSVLCVFAIASWSDDSAAPNPVLLLSPAAQLRRKDR